jgi:anti-sigma factor RsiW
VKSHPGEDDLQSAVDGALAADAAAAVASHLQECLACRRAAESLGWARGQAARLGGATPLPPDLAGRIAAALDEEDRRAALASARPPARRLAPAAVLAAALLLAVAILAIWRGGRADLPSSVAADFRSHAAGTLPLALHTADVERMEQFFARNGVPFSTRVFDLGMMGQELVGGRVHSLRARPSALFVYRGRDGSVVLCEMYAGTLAELPPPAARVEHEGIAFQIYDREGLTLVFWMEGEVVCVLVGAGREAVVQLAFAKAMKAA